MFKMRTMKDAERLSCVITGSFKFKPEIDEVYDELRDNGIKVLAPEKGWLYLPLRQIIRLEELGTLRPLPSEKDMNPKDIERVFLSHLDRANFMYLMNPEDYIGLSGAFEIGWALAKKKPIYANKEINPEAMSKWQDWESEHLDMLADCVRVVPIPEITEDYYKNL